MPERVPPGHQLVIPDGVGLLSLAMGRPQDGVLIRRTDNNYLKSHTLDLITEFSSILRLVRSLVPPDQFLLSKTVLIGGKSKYDPLFGQQIEYETIEHPEFEKMGAKELGFLDEFGRSWPRDTFSVINGRIYISPSRWLYTDDTVTPSGLGEGGKVLVGPRRGETGGTPVLVSKDLWNAHSTTEIARLQDQGLKISWLPIVDRKKQRHDFFHENRHVDGHANLLQTSAGELVLVVANSYLHQDSTTTSAIKANTRSLGVRVLPVNDWGLPPLSLNLIQLLDGTVAMGGGADQLEKLIIDLVGRDQVFTTDIDLRFINSVSAGNIRCLTNILPPLPPAYWETNGYSLAAELNKITRQSRVLQPHWQGFSSLPHQG